MVWLGGIHIALALEVQQVRFGEHSDKIRLVIELDQTTSYQAFAQPDPSSSTYRLNIDLPDFVWNAPTIKKIPVSQAVAVQSEKLSGNSDRIAININRPFIILNSFSLPAESGNAHRIVVDYTFATAQQFHTNAIKKFGSLQQSNTKTSGGLNTLFETLSSDSSATQKVIQPVIPEKKPLPSPSQSATHPQSSSLYKPLIAIDAGHGGNDPGAIGSTKLKEKNVTLAAAKALKKELEKTGKYRVFLTRSDDTYIKLYKRVALARAQKADLFISLHADSVEKGDARGASVYTLSDKASDAQTAKLAARENQVDLIAGVDLSHEDKEVADILLDLAMRDTMNQSKFFANTVVKHFSSESIRLLPHAHRFAGFAVLKAADIPSVLIEMGFMSNRSESIMLADAAHQQKIARAITRSIDAYFQKIHR